MYHLLPEFLSSSFFFQPQRLIHLSTLAGLKANISTPYNTLSMRGYERMIILLVTLRSQYTILEPGIKITLARSEVRLYPGVRR